MLLSFVVMDEECSSIIIGESTLAAIESVEYTEHLKKYLGNTHDSFHKQCIINDINAKVKHFLPVNYSKEKKRAESKDIEDIYVLEKKGTRNEENGHAASSNDKGPKEEQGDTQDIVNNISLDISNKCTITANAIETPLEAPMKYVKCNLEEWSLPFEIIKRYKEMGIEKMFQWQVECLSNECFHSGKNLIYSAPTSAGKTLIAEILTIKTVMERKKKAVIILPFVSVVKEKSNYFQALLEGNGIRVEGFMGGHSPAGGFQRTDVAVCTIEKANGLINRLMEDGNLDTLGIVVVDELHLLGDSHRGYLLELLLTKIRYMCEKENICIQIVGMSATLPNLEILAKWLEAELYQTDFRPVPLREFVKLGKVIYDRNMKQVSKIDLQLPIERDSDDVTFLCLDTIAQGFSVLIFCPTKSWCEKLAETIARDFCMIGNAPLPKEKEGKKIVEKFIDEVNKSPLSEVLERLKRSPGGLDPILARTVLLGVAFHHAGLTMDERDILEASFRSGSLRVLVATSTLSSGVNLPARRVIVRTPVFHGQLIDILTYRQMIGRAGRMGVDTAGESILICQEREKGLIKQLIESELPPIQSCLGGGRSTKLTGCLKRAIFEVITSGVACTAQDVERYTDFTLLMSLAKNCETSGDCKQLPNLLKDCIKYLEENEFIKLEKSESNGIMCYTATLLGEACLAASLPPDQAIALFEELQRARKCFVLEDELHIVYQVTPFSVADLWGNNLDWLHMLNIWESLPASMQRVGELVGIEERFIVRAMRGSINTKASKQMEKMAIHRRFYTALALQELANEVPLSSVAHKYGCSRGMLQNLQQSAATFAGMVTQFCHRLRWSGLELLASQFQDRLQYGIRRELCDLMRLPMLDGQCARALFDVGIESLTMLATETSPEEVDKALKTSIPFQSVKNKNDTGEEKREWRWSSARNLIGKKNAALLIIEGARKIIQKDLGIAEMKWKSNLEYEDQNECVKNEEESELNSSPLCPSRTTLKNNKLGDRCNSLKQKTDSFSFSKEIILNGSMNDNDPGKRRELVQSSNSHNLVEEKVILEKVEIVDNLSSNSILNQSFSGLLMEYNSPLNSKHNVTDAISTPSPVASIMLKHHARKSNDSNKAKRTSVDIFSTPVSGESSISKVDDRSPSLFGDSFEIDTQLSNLLDGSSGSNKSFVCPPRNDTNMSIEKTCEQNTKFQKTNISSDHISKVVSPSALQKLSFSPSLANKLNFDQTCILHTSSPLAKNSPDDPKTFHICAAEGTLTPGKWDFESMIKFEETLCNKSKCGKDISMENRSLGGGKEGVDNEGGNSKLASSDKQNLSGICTSSNSFLERAFATVFDFEENFTLRVEDIVQKTEREKNLSIRGGGDEKTDVVLLEEEGWGSHSHNCSIEAIHHSIIGVPLSDDDDDDDDDMVASSQGERFGNTRIDCTRTFYKKESFSNFSSKKKKNNIEESKIVLKNAVNFEETNVWISENFHTKNKNTIMKENAHLVTETISKKPKVSCIQNFKIVDICEDGDSFKVFCKKLESQTKFSFSVAISGNGKFWKDNRSNDSNLDEDKNICDLPQTHHSKKRKNSDRESEMCTLNFLEVGGLLGGNSWVQGVSFYWGDESVYYVSLDASNINTGDDLSTPSYGDRITFLRRMFDSVKKNEKVCISFDLKEQLKALIVGCKFMPLWKCKFWDPKIADWLLHPTDREKNIRTMCLTYCLELWKVFENCKECSPLLYNKNWSTDVRRAVPPRLNSAIESLVALKSMSTLEGLLAEEKILTLFAEIEMPIVCCLVQMEVIGIGFDKPRGDKIKTMLLSDMRKLEKKAYLLAGHQFRISSSAEISKVLYRELKLPTLDCKYNPRKKKLSTDKPTLEKLTSFHPLPQVLLEWRKINSIMNKTVYPLSRQCQGDRVLGVHTTHTATGRIFMNEPNLQNIPRDFEILSLELKQGNSCSSGAVKEDNLEKLCVPKEENRLFSIRQCFIPAPGFVFLSADFSQLELRIMAHLSKDKNLRSILNQGCDVFNTIASLWKGVKAEEVTPNLRQQAKKICYGIIYGIGCKSLAQQLEVEENEALSFMETFKNSFPGLKAFLISTVEQCRAVGFVKTVGGRKRYLPAITNSNPALKAQAERQAVNSTIQGSAADLVKSAMVSVEAKLREKFPPWGYTSSYHSQKIFSQLIHKSFKRQRMDEDVNIIEYPERDPAGAILVLNLHDELLYEVAEPDLKAVALIVKLGMETAWKISVKLPVNLKVGKSWGALCDFNP